MSEMVTEQVMPHIQRLFDDYISGENPIYLLDIDPDALWNAFLDAMPEEENVIFQERRRWECNSCHNFIKTGGRLAFIGSSVENGLDIITMWDTYKFEKSFDERWAKVFQKVSEFVHTNAKIVSRWIPNARLLGTRGSRITSQINGAPVVLSFWHFHLTFDRRVVIADPTNRSAKISQSNSSVIAFRNSLENIDTAAIELVMDMINEDVLYRGGDYKAMVTRFMDYKKSYDKISDPEKKEIFTWRYGVDNAGIRNSSIGALLEDISSGVDIEAAVKKYEVYTAPSNYKRPKPVFTKKMLEQMKNTIIELGLENSLQRRFATLDDISVNDIIYVDRTAAKRIKGGSALDSIMEDMEALTVQKPVNIDKDKILQISRDELVKEHLPKASKVELLVENSLAPAFVSLIAPLNGDSPSIMAWENGFGWAYNGNIADSDMKAHIQALGGDTVGDLRFSIMWSDNTKDDNDYDAHCNEIRPSGIKLYEIFFSNKGSLSPNGGKLDVDIIQPSRDLAPGKPAVENIIYKSRETMSDGTYQLFVHVYTNRDGDGPLSAEVEFDGKLFRYKVTDVQKYLRDNGNVFPIAEVTKKGDTFTIKHLWKAEEDVRRQWGLPIGQFAKVSSVMYSPNFWEREENHTGHQHIFFMLEDCLNPDTPNGFFNEFLRPDLREHRKVFEALSSRMAVEHSEDQLSGVGFSYSQRNSAVFRITEDGIPTLVNVNF